MTWTIWRNSGQVFCLSIENCIFFSPAFDRSFLFHAFSSAPLRTVILVLGKRKTGTDDLEQRSTAPGVTYICDLFLGWYSFVIWQEKRSTSVACSVHPWPFFDLDSPSPNIFLRVMHSLLKFVSLHLARCIADRDAPAECLVTCTLESNLIILNNQFCYLLDVWP